MRLVLPFLITFGAASAGGLELVEVRRGGDRVDIFVAGRPFTSYYFGPATAKPCLFPLRSAQGTVVTRSFPMADVPGEDHDEPHQRAMYFAHGDINGYDFWGEAEYARWSHHSRSRFGRTVFRELDKVRSGAQSGSLEAQFDLVTSDGRVIATETQAYTFSGDDRYGLLAANPFGLKTFLHDPHQDGGYIIPDGESMTLRYRVFIHHGDFREARVAEAYKQYAKVE